MSDFILPTSTSELLGFDYATTFERLPASDLLPGDTLRLTTEFGNWFLELWPEWIDCTPESLVGWLTWYSEKPLSHLGFGVDPSLFVVHEPAAIDMAELVVGDSAELCIYNHLQERDLPILTASLTEIALFRPE